MLIRKNLIKNFIYLALFIGFFQVIKRLADVNTQSANFKNIMAKGKVAKFFGQNGLGFIKPDEGGKDLFVHINEVDGDDLQEGDSVEYDEKEGPKGPQATNVKIS